MEVIDWPVPHHQGSIGYKIQHGRLHLDNVVPVEIDAPRANPEIIKIAVLLTTRYTFRLVSFSSSDPP